MPRPCNWAEASVIWVELFPEPSVHVCGGAHLDELPHLEALNLLTFFLFLYLPQISLQYSFLLYLPLFSFKSCLLFITAAFSSECANIKFIINSLQPHSLIAKHLTLVTQTLQTNSYLLRKFEIFIILGQSRPTFSEHGDVGEEIAARVEVQPEVQE